MSDSVKSTSALYCNMLCHFILQRTAFFAIYASLKGGNQGNVCCQANRILHLFEFDIRFVGSPVSFIDCVQNNFHIHTIPAKINKGM